MGHTSKNYSKRRKSSSKKRRSNELPDPVYGLGVPFIQAKKEENKVGSDLYSQMASTGVLDEKGLSQMKAAIPDPWVIFEGVGANEVAEFIRQLGNVTMESKGANNMDMGNLKRVIPYEPDNPYQATFQTILVQSINRRRSHMRFNVDNTLVPFDENDTGKVNMNKLKAFSNRDIGLGTKLGRLIQMTLIGHIVAERAATPRETGNPQYSGRVKAGDQDLGAAIQIPGVAHAAGENAEKQIFDSYFQSLGRPETVQQASFGFNTTQVTLNNKACTVQTRTFSTLDLEGNRHNYFYSVTFENLPNAQGAGKMINTNTNLPE